MLRKFCFPAIFLVLVGAITPVIAQTVPFGLYPTAEFSPDFEVLESNENLIRFTLDMARLQPTGTIDLNQKLPGTWGQMNATGALIPRFSFFLALPPTGNPTVTIENWTNASRSAVARTIPENNPNDPRVFLGDVGILGGVRVVPVTVKPVTYTNGQTSCQILDSATIRINLDSQQGQNPLTAIRPAYSESWRSVFQAVVMNWQNIPNLMVREPSHILMFIPDAFISSMDAFVNWKRQMGMVVTIVPVSEINGDNNGNQLRARILTELNAASVRVDHVILAGDETVIPVHTQWTDDPVTRFSTFSLDGMFTNEGHFTELEGTDPFPDVFMGRWPVNLQTEFVTIANRTMAHESTPYAGDSLRFQRSVVSADHSVPSQRVTIAYSREMLLREGFQVVDTVYSQFNPSPERMVQAVNQGVTFVNHRGSGWNQGWAGISFYTWTVPQISNSTKLPIVTGIGCGVAKFDVGDAQCFGEEWMTHGTASNPQGAVGFIGPCWNTHTVYNDVLDTCLYRAFLDYNIDNLMPALVAGKMFEWAIFADFLDEDPVNQILTLNFRQYLVLSDPSLMVYSGSLVRLPISVPPAIPAGPYTLPISISEGFTTQADSLLFSLRNESGTAFARVIPAQPGTWTIPVDFEFGEPVVVTMTGHNVLTRQWTLTVAPEGVYLTHRGHSLSDAAGNSDGRIQPGETILLTDTVSNIGNDAGFSVTSDVTIPQQNITLLADHSNYGTVAAGASVAGNPAYSFVVTPEFRGANLTFDVSYAANGVNPRNEQFFATVYVPDIERTGLGVIDGNDGLLERNEEAGLIFTLRNTGNETLVPSTLTIGTQSPYIVIIDDSAELPALAPDQSYTLPTDAVRIAGNWNAPTGVQATIDAVLTAQMPTYEFQHSMSLPLVLGQVGTADPQQGSDQIYYIYDDLDVDYEAVAVFDWLEISPEEGGAGMVLPFTQSNQTFAVPVPFDYNFFGTTFSNLSVSTDGWVAPGITEAVSYDNRALPYAPDAVNGMIAVLWNDLWDFFGDTTGTISYYYDTSEDRFVVEWYQVTDWQFGRYASTFQIQLLNPDTYPTPTGDAQWLLLYQDLAMHANSALGATIGYESLNEQHGATYYFNQTRPATSAELANGRALRLTTAPPTITDVPDLQQPVLPANFALFQNYPNPFNPETTIEFALAARANVKLEVFDLLGRSVAQLTNGVYEAGRHRLHWNGAGRSGVSAPSGIYFYRLSTPDFVQTRRMLLMR